MLFLDSVVLPFNYTDYAGDLIAYVDQLEKGATSKFNKTYSEFQILQKAVRLQLNLQSTRRILLNSSMKFHPESAFTQTSFLTFTADFLDSKF